MSFKKILQERKQVEQLQVEFSRLETFRERRAEEIREMAARIEKECIRLGVEPGDYKVDGELAGAAGVRAAKMGLQSECWPPKRRYETCRMTENLTRHRKEKGRERPALHTPI